MSLLTTHGLKPTTVFREEWTIINHSTLTSLATALNSIPL
nr:MAG TPA: hypothetical protein [Bacteriophage sp.]